MKKLVLVVFTAFLLGACGEKPQTSGGGSNRDTPPYMGTGVAALPVPAWKAGDKTGWELALRARTQHGQNEFNRGN